MMICNNLWINSVSIYGIFLYTFRSLSRQYIFSEIQQFRSVRSYHFILFRTFFKTLKNNPQ